MVNEGPGSARSMKKIVSVGLFSTFRQPFEISMSPSRGPVILFNQNGFI